MSSTFVFILIGLVTGVVTGITGASGVLIVVPLLTIFLDMPIKTVLGTSLIVDVIASISVAIMYAKNDHIDAKKGVWILVGALLGAQAGSFLVVGISKIFLSLILSFGILFFGALMWKNGSTQNKHRIIAVPERLAAYLRKPFVMVILGVLIGLATGIWGAGGGLAIFIVLYSLLRLPIKTAIGSSVFIMLFTALSGVAGYIKWGQLDLQTGLIIGISAAVGGALSSSVANRIGDKVLARIIGIFFVSLAVALFIFKVAIPFN